MFIFRVQYFWIHSDYDDYGYAVVVVLVLRYYTLSPITSIGLLQNKKLHHPCWEYRFFWISPPEFPVKFTVIPLEFSIFFCIDPPLEIHVFSSIFGPLPGIATNFALRPWNFPLVSSTGGYNFFSGKAHFHILSSTFIFTPVSYTHLTLPTKA